jgi:hypothetical protein
MTICLPHRWITQGGPFTRVNFSTNSSFFQGWITVKYQLVKCRKCGKVQRRRVRR